MTADRRRGEPGLLAQLATQRIKNILALVDAATGQHPERTLGEHETHHQHVVVFVDDETPNRGAEPQGHSFGVSFRPSLNMR